MKRQKTLKVEGKTIKIVSKTCQGPGVRTDINGAYFFSNVSIMEDYKLQGDGRERTKDFYEEFIKRAMDRAYIEWVKGQFDKEGCENVR